MTEPTRRRRPDIVRADRLRELEQFGKLRFVRQCPPDRAAGLPRRYVVDFGRGDVEIAAGEVDGWIAGFAAGLIAKRADVPLENQLEDMEQPALRALSQAVNKELKRRRS